MSDAASAAAMQFVMDTHEVEEAVEEVMPHVDDMAREDAEVVGEQADVLINALFELKKAARAREDEFS